ncbi:hypothetical protein [Burkholderia gladioli]|uniref:hypothetical protein n=1 Tax=Burkholderia gladioli TaxID=28095 RepID=UPI00163F6FDA|nr:hypothetical protein [Burkholderia gladioli]
MLLPLSTDNVRSLSLGHHMALAVVRSGNGDCDQVVSLLRVVYLAFFMRGETASGSDLDLYSRAEAVLDACIARAERDEPWTLHENEAAMVERLLVLHDEQLGKRLSSTVVQVVDGGDPRRYRMGSTRAVDGSDSATFYGSSSSMRLAGWSAMRSST